MRNTERAASSDNEVADAELIERALSGEGAAFRAIVLRYEPVVARTVRGMLGPGPDAEDVGQEVFIRLHRSLGGFRGEALLKTYLTRIAINLSLNALQGRRRRSDRFVPADDIDRIGSGSDPARESEERREIVRAAVEQLDPKHRAVVVLRMMDGCSTRETASMLSLPEGTVLSRLSRAMKMLRTVLQPYGDEL